MMQNSTMSDMIRQMMEKKQGGGDGFTMMGQYTSTVQQEQGPDGGMREFVMYDDGDGNEIKVYGNWNEYAQGQDEEGNMFLPDEDFPIMKNEQGEFVLNERKYEDTMSGVQDRQKAEALGRSAQGGQGASRMEDLMEKLADYGNRKMMGGGKIYRKGGKFPDLNKDGKVTMADILMGRGVRRR